MIKVIYGPMFSGKTKELLRLIEEDERKGRKVKLFKPFIDGRCRKDSVIPTDSTSVKARRVRTTPDGISKMRSSLYNDKPDVIGIDEVQFFPEDLANILAEFSPTTDVIVAGLDLDFTGSEFETTRKLMDIADNTLQLKTVCSVCGGEATMTQRIASGIPYDDDNPRILVGGRELYEPRCEKCHLGTKVCR